MDEEMSRDVKTVSGYALDEIASAVQKCCRKGLVYEAVYWVKELIRSNYAAYAWRRIFVIVSEDVGPGCPDVAVRVAALHAIAVAYVGKKTLTGEDWQRTGFWLLHAVVEICLAEKSRMVAEVAYLAKARYEAGERLEMPDFALDPHTRRGRALGRKWGTRAGVRFWQEHSRVVFPERVLDGDRWKRELDEFWAAERYPDDVAGENGDHDDR